MDEFKQYDSLLNSVDMEESIKTQLTTAFANLENSTNSMVSQLKDRITKESDKPRELKQKLSEIKQLIGVSDDATYEDLTKNIESLISKQGDTIPKDKYENDLSELRNLNKEKDDSINDISTKYEDLQFRINVEDKGLLKDFIDNPIIKKTMTDDLKAKLVFENGNAFIKDENGNIQKDIQTGEPLPVESLVESYKSSPLYKDFVKNPISANGSGVREPSNGTPKQGTKVSDFTIAELREMKAKEPQRYEALEKNK